MVCVVGVRFKLAGKVYYFDPAELPIAQGDRVIVETVRGVEYGQVVVAPKEVPDEEVVQPLKRVIRIGTERDDEVAAANKVKEKEAFAIALKKIAAHELEMYLVDVEYTFDGSKIIFYFTAEGRVDFRELVRDLASVFRTRIEMRQIGVRDEAKLLGGIGPCGRVLCCTSFLGDFAPVSIRMAKDQNLSLNPSKISGLCGRLMCCLRYEQETYEAAKKDPTLAPGYVPPVPPEPEIPDWDEERLVPAIGVRDRSESGFSARVAQALEERREAVEPARRPGSSPGRGRAQGEGGRSEARPGGERRSRPAEDHRARQEQRPRQEQAARSDSRPGRERHRPKPEQGNRQEQRPRSESKSRPDQRPRPEQKPRQEQQRPRPAQATSPAASGEAHVGQPPAAEGTAAPSRRRRRRRGPRPAAANATTAE